MGIALMNPINGVMEKISYSKLSEMTGKTRKQIAYCKTTFKSIDNLNKYYVVDDKLSYKDKVMYLQKFKPTLEVWKEIIPIDFNIVNDSKHIKYFVSDLGRVKRYYNKKERIVMQYTRKEKKTLYCKIFNNELRVHKIVAMYFLEKPENDNMVVYHIDGNLSNNDCENLKWISSKKLGEITGGTANSKPVLKIDIETDKVLDFYESYAEAGRDNYLHRSSIKNAIDSNQAIAGGFKWVLDNNSLAF